MGHVQLITPYDEFTDYELGEIDRISKLIAQLVDEESQHTLSRMPLVTGKSPQTCASEIGTIRERATLSALVREFGVNYSPMPGVDMVVRRMASDFMDLAWDALNEKDKARLRAEIASLEAELADLERV